MSLTVKTPYQFLHKYHKKVYPSSLKERQSNKMVVQSPEIDEKIGFKNSFDNLINNIC